MIEILDGMLRGQVESTNLAYLLMDIAEHQNCVIQKYYWISKFDNNVQEEIEPKILGAFDCVVYIKGKKEDLECVKEIYDRKEEMYKQLPSGRIPLTEQELKDISLRFFQKALNF